MNQASFFQCSLNEEKWVTSDDDAKISLISFNDITKKNRQTCLHNRKKNTWIFPIESDKLTNTLLYWRKYPNSHKFTKPQDIFTVFFKCWALFYANHHHIKRFLLNALFDLMTRWSGEWIRDTWTVIQIVYLSYDFPKYWFFDQFHHSYRLRVHYPIGMQ